MPSKRHEELRAFGHRLLSYMGFQTSEIIDEYRITITSEHGKQEYRIDIAGVSLSSRIKNFDECEPVILIEIGTNKYDKIHHLRMAGYMVMVIPYSENEEEWQDEKKLLEIMAKSNRDLYVLYKEQWERASIRWRQTADERINEIRASNERVAELHKEFNAMEEKAKELWNAMVMLKKAASNLEIPFGYDKQYKIK